MDTFKYCERVGVSEREYTYTVPVSSLRETSFLISATRCAKRQVEMLS